MTPILGKGLTRNLLEAIKYLKLAAEQEYPPAQYLLGVLYDKGEGVKKDETEALRLYQLAAEQGHALAQKVMKEKTGKL